MLELINAIYGTTSVIYLTLLFGSVGLFRTISNRRKMKYIQRVITFGGLFKCIAYFAHLLPKVLVFISGTIMFLVTLALVIAVAVVLNNYFDKYLS